ncbi:DUF6345 domain-containing protein [Rhodococcus sp. NPDC058514]|uniref:DUF6345 domain-containing protein n=1 Tax=unclassified Rhodococcus (in: high G+C Gram-positive bacteria) TaxID=192944 RepID=UPI003660F1FE
MATVTRVDYGVEWTSVGPAAGTSCSFEALAANWSVASAVLNSAQSFGHTRKFAWGNADAWAADYEHPEQATNGDSLNMIDNVHLAYYVDHGASETGIAFASNRFNCLAFYARMRLGVKLLRWMVLDTCSAVIDPVDASVMRTWSAPTDGDSAHPLQALHVLCAFIGISYPGIDTNRGAEFVTAVSRGTPVGPAWLDAAFARSGSAVNRPIAIAPGNSGANADFRLSNDRLSDRDAGPAPATHLSWMWRG